MYSIYYLTWTWVRISSVICIQYSSFSAAVSLSCILNQINNMNINKTGFTGFSQGFFIQTTYLWLGATLKIHSLTKKVFRRKFFAIYFAWNQNFSISEWFPTTGQHIKVQEAMIKAKYFIIKWKVLKKSPNAFANKIRI